MQMQERQRQAGLALRQAAFARLQALMKTDLTETGRKTAQLIHPIREELQNQLQRLVAQGRASAPQAGDALGGFGSCFHIIVRMGVDMVKGTSQVAEFTTEHLGGVIQSTTRMKSILEASVNGLRHDLDSQNHQIAARWLAAAEKLPDGSIAESLMDGSKRMVVQSIEHNINAIAEVSAGVLSEGVVIYLQRHLLRRVLGGFARRAAQVLGANLALAVADGPLPFGEAVALLMDIGFSIWTAWDVFWISRELPGKITQNLCEGLYTSQQEALALFDQQAADLLEAANKQRREAAEPVLAMNPAQVTTNTIIQ